MSDLPQQADRALTALVLLLPGALLVLLSLRSGGFFPDWSAVATVAVLLALMLRCTLGSRAFSGVSAGVLGGGAALTAFTAWVLLSGSWSGAWSRALLEYSRDLGYLVVFVLFGLLGRAPGRARLLVLGLAAAAALVSALALLAWLRPDLLPVSDAFERERLNWPLGYWNSTGLVAGFGALWCVHLSCADASRVVRVVATALVPVCVMVVYYSVSRGAAVAAVTGLAVYLLAGPSRGLLTGGPVCLAATLGALLVARHADALNVQAPTPAALDDGRSAAIDLLLLGAAAAAARAALLLADARLARVTVSPPVARRARIGLAVAVVVATAIALPLGGAHGLHRVYDNIFHGGAVSSKLPPGERFRNLSLNSRVDHWDVALHEGFDAHPVHGAGAGTYAVLWARARTTSFTVVDGHSLYVEVLGELGLVGLALLVVALLAMLAALARRTRGPDGPVWGVLLAAMVAWAVRAGIDWDWEMPAVTLWVMAAGGLALAGSGERPGGQGTLPVRVAVGLGCLLLALLPFAVLRSQTALTQGISAFRAGDCPAAIGHALDATAALGPRPEPFELLAWCDVRLGRSALALNAVAAGLRRDPDNWELHYDDALVRAAVGRDPVPAIMLARARNPLQPSVLAAIDAFRRHRGVRARMRFARRAPLPLASG